MISSHQFLARPCIFHLNPKLDPYPSSLMPILDRRKGVTPGLGFTNHNETCLRVHWELSEEGPSKACQGPRSRKLLLTVTLANNTEPPSFLIKPHICVKYKVFVVGPASAATPWRRRNARFREHIKILWRNLQLSLKKKITQSGPSTKIWESIVPQN